MGRTSRGETRDGREQGCLEQAGERTEMEDNSDEREHGREKREEEKGGGRGAEIR